MSVETRFFESVYKQGLAIGGSYIRDDTVVLRYRDEVFEFPSAEVSDLLSANGTYYTAPVKKLRVLQKKKKESK